MADPITWENIPKSQTEAQTILEAIDEKINTHNGDPEAHIVDLSSFEEHRKAEIIDHLAESVVNDKLKKNARRYVAIVDPASDTDFDTIAAACEYALANGGGDILIQSGNHYLANEITIDGTISLFGLGSNETHIYCESSTNGYFDITPNTATTNNYIELQGITFHSDALDHVFYYAGDSDLGPKFAIQNCTFTGGGEYIQCAQRYTSVNNSKFSCGLYPPFTLLTGAVIENCTFIATQNGARGAIAAYDNTYRNCNFLKATYTGHNWLTFDSGGCIIDTCFFDSQNEQTFNPEDVFYAGGATRIAGCRFLMKSGCKITIDCDQLVFTQNHISGGTGNLTLAAGSSRVICCLNRITTNITNSGTGNIVANNVVGG